MVVSDRKTKAEGSCFAKSLGVLKGLLLTKEDRGYNGEGSEGGQERGGKKLNELKKRQTLQIIQQTHF